MKTQSNSNAGNGCPATTCSARFVYGPFAGQFWVMDNAEDCKCVAMCVRADDAELVAMALNIRAEIQCQLIDDHQRMKDEICTIPRTGTGTLTRRHKLRGAMDFGIEFSNWVSRREIELSRQNGCIEPIAAKRLTMRQDADAIRLECFVSSFTFQGGLFDGF